MPGPLLISPNAILHGIIAELCRLSVEDQAVALLLGTSNLDQDWSRDLALPFPECVQLVVEVEEFLRKPSGRGGDEENARNQKSATGKTGK